MILALTAIAFCLAGQKLPAPLIVCIDPGHPSEVSRGDVVQNGTTEVSIGWIVGQKLRDRLRSKGYKVVMTKRSKNQFVKNKDRAKIANASRSAVMVRLHCDTGRSRGFVLYYPDRQARRKGVTGPSFDVIKRSGQAAHAIRDVMMRVLHGKLKDGGVRGDSKTRIGARQGALTGSIYSKVPIVTIEMVVLSNKNDAAFIKSPRGQQLMTEAIATGVEQYLSGN